MKRSIFILIIATIIFCSCQKEDKNGDLGGMWKLLEIERPNGQIENTKEQHIFWRVQLKLIKIDNQVPPPTVAFSLNSDSHIT